MCLMKSGGMAVSVSDKLDFVIRKNSIRAVILLDDENEQKDMLQYCGNSNKRHFTLPTKLSENRNSDLCVIDRFSDNLGRLAVISRDGKFRFEYKGPSDADDDPFDPLDVAVAGDGCILIVDKILGVHQVTSRGTLARLLLTERQGLVSPRSVTVDEERKAWVGCEKGIIIRVWTFIDPRHRPLTSTDNDSLV
ncbi:hypothetical protein FSP39_001343 [Pinctada imbricata]|uniref:Uncharacterized protein n=1 Tax=Pinctada imbricata TaxID=66713 RepID=A0AA89CCF4_PINIB|nr:hypothetical protein FSP39_001343 [Pinctada imbricata]